MGPGKCLLLGGRGGGQGCEEGDTSVCKLVSSLAIVSADLRSFNWEIRRVSSNSSCADALPERCGYPVSGDHVMKPTRLLEYNAGQTLLTGWWVCFRASNPWMAVLCTTRSAMSFREKKEN